MNTAGSKRSRGVVERILVKGELVLETPTHLGGETGYDFVDMPVLLDAVDGRPLLTGASLAGALRNYLRTREVGYFNDESNAGLTKRLFGRLHESGEGEQSPLIVYDALAATKNPVLELRDGVAINPKTRTARGGKKFDFELLEAGTTFPIRLELLVTEEERAELLEGLAIALQGLQKGEIRLGARKRRGLGRCRVQKWNVCRYDLTTPEGLIGWLEHSDDDHHLQEADIVAALGDNLSASAFVDERSRFTLQATFGLKTSLLIRSGFGEANAPDMVHLHSKRGDEEVPVLSGTSLAGALRARAYRITNTLAGKAAAKEFIDELFGPKIESNVDEPAASRLLVSETEIREPLSLVHTRVKIDRFTGGSYPGALFNQEPVFGTDDTELEIDLTIQAPTDAHIGLALLLLKDLWTGDLPLGGEASVGRGRLHGKQAALAYEDDTWILRQEENRLAIEGDKARLEAMVEALHRRLQDGT